MWCVGLLDFSKKFVGHDDQLILLVSEESPCSIAPPKDAIIYRYPNFRRSWKPENDDDYAVANRHMSLSMFCAENKLNDDDVLLMMDPDMVFVNKIDYEPNHGEVVGQYIHSIDWIIQSKMDAMKGVDLVTGNAGDTIMFPLVMRFSTLKLIMETWKVLSNEVRARTRLWEADMFGLTYAMKHHNINVIHAENIGPCTDWPHFGENDLEGVIHYCQPVVDTRGVEVFNKGFHHTKNGPADGSFVHNEVHRKLIELVNKFESSRI